MIQTCLGNNLPAPSTPKKRPDHRARALFLIAAVRIGIFMFLAISGLVALHLLVNQDKVRPFLVDKARTILDSDLDYSRMKLHFLPVPHLDVRNLRLHRPDVFDLKAGELSLYPALLPMLSGRFQIQRLILSDPDIRIHIAANPLSESDAPHFSPFFSEAENAGPVSGLFAFLAGIDPETRFQVRNGRIRLISNHTVKGEISAITLDAARTGDRISLDLAGVSPFTGSFQVSLESLAESTALQGTLTASAINGAAMSSFFPLPQDIRIKDASGSGSLEFRLSHPDVFLARFNLDMPALTLLRNDKPLPFSGITLSGAMGYLDEEWIFSVDTLNAEKPELAFSGTALFRKAPDTGRPALDVRIFTPRLDIETTGTLVKSIAGTSPDLETAFSIARSGTLTDLSCTATLAQNETNWAVDTISARGRLSCGTISIPEIKANFTEMEGDVVYQDTQAAFRQMQGKFQGVRFSNLSAGIDWTDEDARLSLETPSATVDAAVLFPWLTGLEGLSAIRNHVSAMSGKALISRLEIQGPLTDPENWQFMINAAPDSMVLTTPHAPFPVTLQGGELVYRPGVEHSVRMGVRFLDADLILSHESRGIVPPESVSCQVDGTLGQDAVDWVSGLLSVPPYLVIQWPVTLSGLHIQWDGKDAVTLAGSLKAGDDTTLHGNLRCAQDTWQVEDLRFSDPDSSAVISATRHQDAVSLSFSGHIDKKTADRLLRRNEILDGKISGQFTAHLHLEHPALSTLAGTVSGNGLHLAWLKPVSVAVSRFSLSGNGSRMTVSDSELRINKTAIQIKGDIFRKDSAPRMDLALKLDTLDLDWLKGLLDAANASATENETPRTPEVLSGAGGTVQLLADRFQADRFTVSPLDVVMKVEESDIHAQVKTAVLCGIATTGDIHFTSGALSLDLGFAAEDADLNETADCLLDTPFVVDARYRLSGQLSMPPTTTNYLDALTGTVTLTSENGRIVHGLVLMRILSILNITELLTGGGSDLTQKGYGYSLAEAQARLSNRRVQLSEILLDGSSLKLTGEGVIDLSDNTADIFLLAAPMRTLDRIVSHVPVLNYLSDGRLVSIPLRVHGPVTDPSVVPLSPAAVGKSMVNMMRRVLDAPFRLVDFMTPENQTP